MPAQTRIGDHDTGHDACPARGLKTGSGNVLVNGIPAGRVGDRYAAHGCVLHPAHDGEIAAGSATVVINGRPAGRVGDPVSCGGSVAAGSPNVIVGG